MNKFPLLQLVHQIDYYFQAIQTSSANFKRRQRLTMTPEINNDLARDDDKDTHTHTYTDKCTHIDRISRQKQKKESIIH